MFKQYSKVMGYVILTVLILAAVGGVLRFAGVFGERVVFENSFQYKEGMSQRNKILDAQIRELEMQKSLYPERADVFNKQISVLRVQLN